MPLTTHEITALANAGFERKYYPEQEDLCFYAKKVPCESISFMARSPAYEEMFLPNDLAEVEVVGNRRLIQIVVQDSDYITTDIELDDELGRSILADCGMSAVAIDR